MPPRTSRPVPGPKRRGAAVVQRVLAITLEQLAVTGYERLSVPDIAAKAGLNKTSVYRRWPNKVALVGDAMHSTLGQAGALPDTGSLRGDLLALTQFAMAFAQSPLGMGVLRMLLAEGFNPDVRGLATALFREQETPGHQLVFTRAIARGELHKDADIQMALTAVAGTLLQRVFVEQAPVTKAFVERLIDLVLLGLIGHGTNAAAANGQIKRKR
jgi:AcrR family transcriptional regulator